MITKHVPVAVMTVVVNIFNSIYLANNVIFAPGKYFNNYDFNLIFLGLCPKMEVASAPHMWHSPVGGGWCSVHLPSHNPDRG